MAESSIKYIHQKESTMTAEIEVNIRDLLPRQRNRIIEAVVYRAWIARDPPDTNEKGYRVILLDRQGDAIQGNMEAADINFFNKILIPGKAYRISRFTCIPTDNWQQTLENTTSLSFTRFTKFDTIPAHGFPPHYFNFIAYNQLPYRVVDPDDTTRKEYPILTDYIGCYISSGKLEKVGDPNKDQMINRRIEIQNLNRMSIELTLWDQLAESFKKEEIDSLERPIIIAVSSCRVSRRRNKLQLSATPATYYYINPKIPQLERYRAEYAELFDLNPPLEIVRQPYKDKEKEKMRNRFELAVLLKQTPKTYEGVRFTCEGSITSINTSRDWYYPGCTKCSLKIENHDGLFECRVHGPLDYPSYRYNFRAYVSDSTATVLMTFFSPKANDIVGIDCNSLVNSIVDPHPRNIPEKIQSIVGKTHIFQFQYNTSSKQPPPEFIFNELLDTPPQPKLIESTPSGSQTPHEAHAMVESNIPECQQITLPVQPVQTEALTGKMETTGPVVSQQQPATGQTPPQAEHVFPTTSSKMTTPTSSKSGNAKRPLFHDNTTDAKKNKTD